MDMEIFINNQKKTSQVTQPTFAILLLLLLTRLVLFGIDGKTDVGLTGVALVIVLLFNGNGTAGF